MQNSLNDFKAALFSGNFHQAETIGLSYLQQNGDKAEWLNEIGILYLMKGDLPEALRFFDRAMNADANFIEAQFNAAIILSDLGFYEEASGRFAEACQKEGALLAKKHFDMALFYLSVRQTDAAEEELKKAITQHQDIEYFIELARLYIDVQKYDESLKQIDLALAINPENLFALNFKEQCLQYRENYLANFHTCHDHQIKINN